MIIDQTIKGGVCTVSKSGKYFQLISAGGIVRVRLSHKGSFVFESKMWVGMNLDKPLQYDTVEIWGDDGLIQFWAGDVSMQHLAFSNDAAKAVKTSLAYVPGGQQSILTDANFVRREIRIRPNKAVTVGGPGVQAWEVAANETISFPVAGSLFGYMPPAHVDVSNIAIESSAPDMWFDSRYLEKAAHVSDDGKIKIAGDTYRFMIQNLNIDSTWREYFYHSTSMKRLVYIGTKNTLYSVMFDKDGYVRLDESTTDGAEFKTLVVGYYGALTAVSEITVSSSHAACVTTKDVQNNIRVIDIATGSVFDVNTASWGVGNVSLCYWMENNIVVRSNTGVYHSNDKGKSFTKIDALGLTQAHKLIITDTGKLIFGNGCIWDSADLSAEHKTLQTTSYFPQYDHVNYREVAGAVFYLKSSKLRYINCNDDSPTITDVLDSSIVGNGGEGVAIPTSEGKIYLSSQTIGSSQVGEVVTYGLVGDPRPALVEVMELLA